MAEQARALPQHVRRLADEVRATGVESILDEDIAGRIDPTGKADPARFVRYAIDRVALAYADPEAEATKDRWDLRVFGRRGVLDFTGIRQSWLRDGVKRWAAVTMPRQQGQVTLQHRVRAVTVLSQVLASGPGGAQDPTALARRDVDRFLLRAQAMTLADTGEPLTDASKQHLVKSVGLIVREATALGFLPGLDPTFSFRRGDARWPTPDDEPGRALPPHVVAQLDEHLELLAGVPGSKGGPAHRSRGVLGERIGVVAVLAYQLLKGTGRRLGEIASLRVNCLDVDETGKAVLVYDNHKASRMGRRLPIADSALVDAIRDQQRWVTGRFPTTPPERLWLLPRPYRNRDGTSHIGGNQLYLWIRGWMAGIPALYATPAAGICEPRPFDRTAITPQAFRHTYAQTLADQGVAPSVLRDLMDHRNINTTLGYYRVSETKKRDAMELLAGHTIDNPGGLRPSGGQSSLAARLREEISWVAVPMGKCSEPTNVRAGGQACPIRYQCAGCPHFESDPSYLPELRGYANELRKEREVLIAFGAAEWVIANVTGQLDVVVDHIRRHEALLETLGVEDRAAIEDASRTVRKVRQSIPVAFGRRQSTADG
jgi:integrase